MSYESKTSGLKDGGYVIVNKTLISKLGINAALMYGELCAEHDYWMKRNGVDDDGWFYSTVENVNKSTGLGHKPQIKAIKTLQENGLIGMEHRGVPPKRFFRILSDDSQATPNIPDGNNQICPNDTFKYSQTTHSNIPKGNIQIFPNDIFNYSQMEYLNIPNGNTNNNNINNNKDNNNKRENNIIGSSHKGGFDMEAYRKRNAEINKRAQEAIDLIF